jgi:uncharacterized membrane protein (DUF4010 family)
MEFVFNYAADFNVFVDFLIAIALGALIGMEREMHQQQAKVEEFAGVRTFILITLFGAIVGFIAKQFDYPVFLISLSMFGFILFVVVSYVVNAVLHHKKIGATTQMSALLAFSLGIMCMLEIKGLAVAITILITIFLSLKQVLHKFAKQINKDEAYATLEFAVISFIILPFLPDKGYGPLNVLNPYNIWLMVVLVSAISLVGYIFMKWKGLEKGVGITGILGGLISSNSVSVEMADESRKTGIASPFVFATVLSSIISYLRVMFIVYIINRSLVMSLALPVGVMAVAGAVFVSLNRKNSSSKAPKIEQDSPFTLVPALKFAFIYTVVLFVTKTAQLYFGETGVFVAALLAGFVDLNAITLSTATLALTGFIPADIAVLSITLAVVSSNFVKILIGYFMGNKEYAYKTLTIYTVIAVAGLAAAMFL